MAHNKSDTTNSMGKANFHKSPCVATTTDSTMRTNIHPEFINISRILLGLSSLCAIHGHATLIWRLGKHWGGGCSNGNEDSFYLFQLSIAQFNCPTNHFQHLRTLLFPLLSCDSPAAAFHSVDRPLSANFPPQIHPHDIQFNGDFT